MQVKDTKKIFESSNRTGENQNRGKKGKRYIRLANSKRS